jgi:Fur family transcriptional regulator, peroxide stress response regulator
MIELPAIARELLEDALLKQGMRTTRQREHVFAVLLHQRDHPSADEVYARAKADMPTISLATVYNCLETLTACGLVRAVNYEREPTRYCPNLRQHAHFQDRDSGRVYDIDLPDSVMQEISRVLPPGYRADIVELYFHGRRDAQSATDNQPPA